MLMLLMQLLNRCLQFLIARTEAKIMSILPYDQKMASMTRRPLHIRQLRPRYVKSRRIKNTLLPNFNHFPFLRNRKTIRHIRSSKVFFLMRGLPGSGKSTVVRSIKSCFKEAVLCSADNFFLQEDGTYSFDSEKLPEAHGQCAEQVRLAAKRDVRHIVIDNTNILRWEMRKYLKLASEFGYAVLLVEPKTPWKLEPVELAARNSHGCPVEVVEKKLKKFKAVLPAYWGWFLNETEAAELLALGEIYFDLCMRAVPEFASYMNELGVAKGLPLPLSFRDFYHHPSGKLLHCTSFFSGMSNHRSPGTDEYADRHEVQHSMGRAFSLKLVGVMISPRTVGIRVILNKFQLPLWGVEDVWFPQPPPKPKNKDATQSTDGSVDLTHDAPKVREQKKNGEQRSDVLKDINRNEHATAPNDDSTQVEENSNEIPGIQLKRGSGAHITLGFAEGYSAVQTGFDQLELLLCEDNEAVVGEPVVADNVEIAYYRKGQCTVYFDWPIYKSALFTGKY